MELATRAVAGYSRGVIAAALPIIVRLTLVAAALYQLGACPCGCLDHNGWCEAVASLIGAATAPPRAEEPCDGHDHPPDPACASSRRAAAEVDTRTEFAVAAGAVGAPLHGTQIIDCSYSPASSPPSVAPPARLRVLRL